MKKYLPVLAFIANRFREPSTWAGMTAVFAAAGFSAGLSAEIVTFGSGTLGIVAMVLSEQGVKPAA
jgi:hypothetical protein